MWRWFFVMLSVCGLANKVSADTIIFSGAISQSTSDGTGPAVNNPELNNITDNDAYTVALHFTGSINAPGTYSTTANTLNGATLTLTDPAAPASETSFGDISLTITENAGFDEFSLLGCLTTGSGCSVGNQLDANFKIPVGGLNSPSVAAIGLDQPHPLDLLEDDGVTDIHGSITSYSYISAETAVPEPSSMVLLGCTLTIVAWKSLRRFAGPRSRSWIDVKKRI